jgi:ferredoxin--NADP+ reductase
MASPWIDGKVTALKDWGNGLYSLFVEADIVPFEAGQFIKIGLRVNDEIVGRAYSLVNAPSEKPLEFYFIKVDNGPLTPRLINLKPGDEIHVAPRASGFLVLSEVPQAKNLWLIATGTGIGPFLSILKTATPWQRFEKIILVQAVRTLAELTYQEEIQRILSEHSSQLTYIPFLSREKTSFAMDGRVTNAIANGRLEEKAGFNINLDSQIMLCGNPDMVRDAIEILATKGLKKHRRRDPGNIIVEAYW